MAWTLASIAQGGGAASILLSDVTVNEISKTLTFTTDLDSLLPRGAPSKFVVDHVTVKITTTAVVGNRACEINAAEVGTGYDYHHVVSSSTYAASNGGKAWVFRWGIAQVTDGDVEYEDLAMANAASSAGNSVEPLMLYPGTTLTIAEPNAVDATDDLEVYIRGRAIYEEL